MAIAAFFRAMVTSGPRSPQGHGHLMATDTCLRAMITSEPWSPRSQSPRSRGRLLRGHGHLRAMVTSQPWPFASGPWPLAPGHGDLRTTVSSEPWSPSSGPQPPTSRFSVTSGLQSPQGHGNLLWGHSHLRAMISYLRALGLLRTMVTSGSSPLTLGPRSPQGLGHIPEGVVTSGPVSYLRAMVPSGLLVTIKMTTMFLFSPRGHSHHRLKSSKMICGSDSALAPQPLAVCFGGTWPPSPLG